MPRCAAANTSTTAPRSMSGAASSGVQSYSRIPNPPAHHVLLRFRSAPCATRTSSIGRFFVAAATGRLLKWPIGSFTAARTSACRSSSSRTCSTSPPWSAIRNRSTGVLVSESILRFIAAQLSKPYPRAIDELRIAQRERIRRGRFRVERGDPRQRFPVGGPDCAQQFLRALLLHLQVRTSGQWFDERRTVVFGRHDDTSHGRGCARCPRRRAGGSSGNVDTGARRGPGSPPRVFSRGEVEVGASLSADRARPARARTG